MTELIVKHKKAHVSERMKLKIQRLQVERDNCLNVVNSLIDSKEEAIVVMTSILAKDTLNHKYLQISKLLSHAGNLANQMAELKLLVISYDQTPDEILELDLVTADWLMV
jgi:hypothetical protein